MQLQHPRFEGLVVASAEGLRMDEEIAKGLRAQPQPWLPAAFLYDDTGCTLFDRICRLDEYYPTRTELALLQQVADDVARRTRATDLVELGSGLARKTHLLLTALGAHTRPLRWIAFDVSGAAVRESTARLLPEFPELSACGVQGDFRTDLGAIPPAHGRRLVAFLGGTLGNFDDAEAEAFLYEVRRLVGPDDHLLIGVDLVKDRAQLHAAYNDRKGVTAQFNLNVLARLERDFGAELELDAFRHDAFFDEGRSRIEMHARAERATRVVIPSLDVRLALAEGSSIRTEISRKFTPSAIEQLLDRTGYVLRRLYLASTPYALVLASVRPPS